MKQIINLIEIGDRKGSNEDSSGKIVNIGSFPDKTKL